MRRSTSSGAGGPGNHREEILRTGVVKAAAQMSDWSTIDWIQAGEAMQLKAGQRKQKSQRGDREMEDLIGASQGWLASVLAGILLGLFAVAIEVGTDFVVSIRTGICDGFFWLNNELCCPQSDGECSSFLSWGQLFGGPTGKHVTVTNYFIYVLLGTFFAGTAAFFCRHYAIFAAGGGINEVKTVVGGQVYSRYFSRWVVCIKALTVCMSTGSGLAVGKEGPFVHIGACCADIVGALFPAFQNVGLRRELLAAGAGGGLAVAFGAPIGGVVFMIEEISSFFSFRSMMQALMCGVTAVLVVKNFDIMQTGQIVQFSIDYRHQWHWFELPLFALLGVFGGLVGSVYNVCNMAIVKNRRASFIKNWPITEVIVIAIVSDLMNYITPFCRGGMLTLLAELFQDCSSGSTLAVCQGTDFNLVLTLIIAGMLKCVLSFTTVGSCVPAGLLVPSLVIGALFGRAYGIFLNNFQIQYSSNVFFEECNGLSICIIPGAYAIVGAAAMLCGVTRMTVCLAVIMFELTGGLEYLVPVIIGILCSKWAAEALGVECIYELGIEMTGLPYLDPKKEFHHENYTSDICEGKKYTKLYVTGMTISDLNDVLERTSYYGFPLVVSPEDDSLYGFVRRSRLIDALHMTAQSKLRHVRPTTLIRFTDQRSLPPAIAAANELAAPAPAVDAVNDGGVETDAGGDDVTLEEDPLPAQRAAVIPETELDFSAYVEDSGIQVSPESSVPRLLYLFKSLGARHVIVTKFARFVGIVTKKDLIAFMRKVEHEEHEEEQELARRRNR